MVKQTVARSLIVWALLLLLHNASSIQEGEAKDISHQLSRPERVDGRREKQDLSTSEKGGHVDDASYRLTAFDKDWTLDVKRNKELIPSSFAVRTFENDGSEVIQEDDYDHCHYQGIIRGMKDSRVVLNTCKGLRGLIDDGHETFYVMPEIGHEASLTEIQMENGTHRVSKAEEDESQDISHKCGNKDIQADPHSLNETFRPIARIQERRKISGHIDEFYKKYLTTDETRYTEIFICVDNEMYQKFNRDKNVIKDRVITLVNTVDAIYQRINIRIVLKYLEIWTNGDPFGRVRNSVTELKNFMAYRNKHLVKRFPHDNALLLSHKSWPPNIVGLAWVNTMCGGYSNSINAWYYESSVGPHATVAHELGHNFGFNHDSGTCKCLSSRGCFMGGSTSRLPGFSDCSLKSLQKVNDACLYNVPTYKAYNSYCGNGIREEGEECDCGTPEMCQAKDPCCEPHNCVLKKESQCSDLHHTCCKNCLFKKRGTLCRGVQTDCDVPEYCTGSSRDCPEDTYIINGYPCSQAKTVIHGNTNLNGVVARDLNPMVNARYLRINPQYWHGWPCLRTDFMGCSAHEANPTAPTPLKSYIFDFCLTPSSKSCSPRDNDPIIFVTGSRCSERHFQFIFKDGLLRHACSGKLVCPENGGTHNGAKIVVSRTCKVADSKLVRTVGRSLKHVKSGRCIHTSGAWPGNGRQMVLWSGCKEQRLQLWFGKQDCVEPLGMQNGEIKDRQITASSVRGQELAYYARLRGKKYWCAKAKSKTEYLQVDLGKVKTVSKILMQGRGNWYDWVTGFFLYYSSDGQRWKTYSASGDEKQSDSFCYLGKCSETLDTQCKDLWGATAKNADQGCYDKLNTEATGYGTCDPNAKKRCASSDVLCGQLQCEADESRKKPVVDYGRARDKKIILPSGKKCNAVELKSGDSIGLGMVREGTKCGPNKMCINNKCQSLNSLNLVGKCPVVGNKECAGRGVCTNKKICHCQGGFDPKNGCKSEEGEKQEGGEEEGEEEYEYSGGEEFEDEEDDTNEEDNEKEVEYEDDEKGEKREGKDLEEDLEMSFAKK
ncbi:zinc metalloproteinase-disintegrin-like atrase-A [Pocillopora verrucosa]|uniref:zinc metalloproteinase-disintegrin-like atrase-A n=1 Tax=Pocillopora verrucosa TaxID=203993 RepID=UPI00333E6304